MNSKVYAEDLPYFKTSQSGADTWLDKAETELKRTGGKITGRGNIQETINGVQAEVIYIAFTLTDDQYRVAFPVLASRSNNTKAARIQAATMMYHDIKARCVSKRVLGARMAFGGYRMLSTGMTDGQMTTPELAAQFLMLPAPKVQS